MFKGYSYELWFQRVNNVYIQYQTDPGPHGTMMIRILIVNIFSEY
jgi:hypothetical protein